MRRIMRGEADRRRPAGRTARAAWFAGAAAILIAAPGCSGRTAPASPSAAPVASAALQFIADDFPRAQEDAKRRSVPIFVEAWAPW